MTAPLREQHQNLANTTLSASINSSDNPISVAAGSVFPSTGNFRIMVDSEIMIVTARSTNSLTVTRGADGTSAASHSGGATVSMIYSTQGLSRIIKDADPLFGYSSRKPIMGLWADDGKTLLTSADFTWLNQGSATAADENGTIRLTDPVPGASGRNVRGLELDAPSTPYTYIAAFSFQAFLDNDCRPTWGMGFRESSSTKLMLFSYDVNSFFNQAIQELGINRWSNPSSLFTTNFGMHPFMSVSDLIWVKIENTGTNLKWHLSPDGAEWIQYFSESKTAWFSSGPDKVLFYVDNENNTATGATALNLRLHHWSKGE
jgi:hypothetical protein